MTNKANKKKSIEGNNGKKRKILKYTIKFSLLYGGGKKSCNPWCSLAEFVWKHQGLQLRRCENRTRKLSPPKRESYHLTKRPQL